MYFYTQPGEYFVVGVDVEQYDAENPGKYLTGMLSNKPDPILEKAFRSFFSVVPTPPRGFKNFSIKVNEYMEKPPFQFPNPLVQLGGVKQVCKLLYLKYNYFFILYIIIIIQFPLSHFILLNNYYYHKKFEYDEIKYISPNVHKFRNCFL